MKISELTAETVKEYCGVFDSDSDSLITDVLMPAAKKYIIGYTGLTAEQCDKHDDIALALMVLVNDMLSEREYTLSLQKQVNPAVKTILSMYSLNNLG